VCAGATKLHKICVKLYDNDLGERALEGRLHVRENGVQISQCQAIEREEEGKNLPHTQTHRLTNGGIHPPF